ncbi:MAG TPA: hydrolase, partial [Bacteroidales bacterium]|nr:hydrolase [Bacteroidales bacterium]
RVKWELLNDAKMNHMAETGIKGIDLYFKNNGIWQYINTARPSGKSNDFLLVGNMNPSMREYKMYLPLYDGVTNLEIGLDSTSNILKPERTNKKPIVFYGTSITQGGCASRPGMVHTSIISRKLAVECINFGFSGNGRMEKPLAELISEIDALFYVMDGTNNMTPEQIHENAIPLVEIIRSRHAATPIIFVEGLLNDRSYLDLKTRNAEVAKNEMLKSEYQEMIRRGFKNIYYIGQAGGKGSDFESTVDGVHLTDLGFSRYADFLLKEFRRIKVTDRKRGR